MSDFHAGGLPGGFPSFFGSLFGLAQRRLEPMTNAGRYLQQLDRGDRDFRCDDEDISDELACALKRIQITSAREQQA